MIRRFKDSDFERLIHKIEDLEAMGAVLVQKAASTGYTVQAVATNLGAADLSNGGNTLTQHTPSAGLGAQDGTNVTQGDSLLLQAGTITTLVVTAAMSGPWYVQSSGSASAPWVLTRPASFLQTSVVPPAAVIKVADNAGSTALWGGTEWLYDGFRGFTLGGGSVPLLYPRRVSQVITLAASFKTIINVPIRSATQSVGVFVPTAVAGTTTTVGYRQGAVASGGAATVAGAIGTASISTTAYVAAGTVSATPDTSTGIYTIFN